jgi:hypothetical protein
VFQPCAIPRSSRARRSRRRFLAAEFGLTPSSEQRLGPPTPDPDHGNPYAGYGGELGIYRRHLGGLSMTLTQTPPLAAPATAETDVTRTHRISRSLKMNVEDELGLWWLALP